LERSRIIRISAIAAGIAGCLGYGEFIHDWRIPRSHETARYAMGTTYSMEVAALNELTAAMKQKYGERAKTILQGGGGTITVMLDDQVVETTVLPKKLNDVYGIFVVGVRDAVSMRFPFQIAPKQKLTALNRSVAVWFRDHFKSAPRDWFAFSDADWTIDRCAWLPAGLGLGSFGETLRLREGTSCMVTWKGSQPGAILVSVVSADGDPWMRPFARRICRAITEAALTRFDPATPGSPNYAGCILVDRPGVIDADKSLAISAYSVGPRNALARVQ
jgi:hypothetical protein